jgi:hypothetical protein
MNTPRGSFRASPVASLLFEILLLVPDIFTIQPCWRICISSTPGENKLAGPFPGLLRYCAEFLQ